MSNKMALDALTAAVQLCEWIAETPHQRGSINGKAAQVLYAASEAIAALQAEQQPAIPEGWGFSSADFSLQASGVSEYGGVMLIRTGADRADWHFLTDEQREVIPLYVSGTGRTVAEAIASAAKNCTPLPSTPPKD